MKHSRRTLLGFSVSLTLLLLGIYLFGWQQTHLVKVPETNGYLDFLQASKNLPKQPIDEDDLDALTILVSMSENAYELVDIGLKKISVVPVEATKAWEFQHGTEVGQLKRMTHAMLARAKVAERSGQIEDAFDLHVKAFRYSAAIGYGGVNFDFMTSISCRALVLNQLTAFAPKMSAEQCAQFISVIEECKPLLEETTIVSKRTNSWSQKIYGWKRRWVQIRNVFETRSLSRLWIVQSQLEERIAIYDGLEKTLTDQFRSNSGIGG